VKRLILLLPVLLLTGCLATVPVKQQWPAVPEELLKACPDLLKVDPNTSKLSDVLQVVTDNYSQYYDCKSKVDDWIIWYNGQKDIYNGK
jgi:hypothetical protein